MSQNKISLTPDLPIDAEAFLLKTKSIMSKKNPQPAELEGLRKDYDKLNKKYNLDGSALQKAIDSSTVKKDTGSMMARIAHKFNNKYWIEYTKAHRQAFRETEKKLLGYNTKEGLNHDRDKIIMYHLFPAPIAHAIHINMAKHHKRRARTTKDYTQMVIDWECNRLTKPDKQMKPYQVMEKFYPDLKSVIVPILRKYNLPTCAAEDPDSAQNIKNRALNKEQAEMIMNTKKKALKESVMDMMIEVYEAEMYGDITTDDRIRLLSYIKENVY